MASLSLPAFIVNQKMSFKCKCFQSRWGCTVQLGRVWQQLLGCRRKPGGGAGHLPLYQLASRWAGVQSPGLAVELAGIRWFGLFMGIKPMEWPGRSQGRSPETTGMLALALPRQYPQEEAQISNPQRIQSWKGNRCYLSPLWSANNCEEITIDLLALKGGWDTRAWGWYKAPPHHPTYSPFHPDAQSDYHDAQYYTLETTIVENTPQ